MLQSLGLRADVMLFDMPNEMGLLQEPHSWINAAYNDNDIEWHQRTNTRLELLSTCFCSKAI